MVLAESPRMVRITYCRSLREAILEAPAQTIFSYEITRSRGISS